MKFVLAVMNEYINLLAYSIYFVLMPYLQAKEESELPEYILGTVRLNRIRLESAAAFEV